MISRLKGVLISKKAPSVVLDVMGVGYQIDLPMSSFYDLPGSGQELVLLTHFMVREDAQLLFGFLRESERALFRTLLKISGVGGKLALAILSGASVDEFTRCIQDGDVAALVRLPGVGKKTAERLIVELRDKLDTISLSSSANDNLSASTQPSFVNEAIDALLALGYKHLEASKMVRSIAKPDMTAEQMIRNALKSTIKS